MQPEDLDPPDPRLRLLRWLIVGLLLAGFGACLAKGADRPRDPEVVTSEEFPGFGEIGFRITPADPQALPSTTEQCALLAGTEQQRARGLMGVTDLKDYVGMLFRYSGDSTGGFYMRNTPMPLSIAWFGGDGRFVSAADMDPCGDRPDCQIYAAAGPYRYALEVPRGELPALGIGPGAVLELTGACRRT